VFDNNTSTVAGGAISVLQSTANIGHSTFYDNSADDRGGAIYAQSSTLVVTDSMFFDNTAAGRGGAIEHFTNQTGRKSGLSIQHSTFLKNTSTADAGAEDGGAIGVFSTSGAVTTTDITGSTLVGNTAVDNGGAVDNNTNSSGSSTVTVIDSVVVQNTASASNNDIQLLGTGAVLIVENTIVDVCVSGTGGCPPPP